MQLQFLHNNLQKLFKKQIKKFSDYTALSYENTTITYRELDSKSDHAAYWLQKNGVLSGDKIVLLFEPGLEFIVLVLSIIKIGAVYVPLDIKAPKLRIEYIIKDVDPKLIITNIHIKFEVKPNVYNLQEILDSSNNFSKFTCVDVFDNSPACIFYTSGTTGQPKGVIVSHGAIVNLTYISNFTKISPCERVAQFSNLAFDAVTFEIWGALLNGAVLLIIPPAIKQDYMQLKQLFINNQVNHIFFPTAYFHQGISLFPEAFDNLTTILFGGEQINVELIKSFLDYRKSKQLPINLFHVYGPTETTTFACFHQVQVGADNDEQIACIGKAIKNAKIYILDEKLQPVKRGDIGELYITGKNLAIGYNKSPILTQQKFISNPFDNMEPFKVLYKTGDKVRELFDGSVLYVGRIDDQVKISGYRMHLHEIENQLLQHSNIAEAALLVETPIGSTYNILIAYLVFKGLNNTIDQIRGFLANHLPLYMIPNKFIQVEKMPLNNNGKIDKSKLPFVTQKRISTVISNDSANDNLNALKVIFAKLLNRDNIDVNRNLFELGANSLIIADACSRINKELVLNLQISDILTYPSIYKLNQYIENRGLKPTTNFKDRQELNIAVIGMSCRFPKANSFEQYWSNLCEGKDCLTRFNTTDDITNDLEGNNDFVPVRGIVEDLDKFDASFFNFDPVDASITDPQQRIFLECAWEAFEIAGNTPDKNKTKTISVFAGMADSTYLQRNLSKSNWFNQQHDLFNARIATSIGTLSTQVSYRLNLFGNSININTACSTSLVAVGQACQDLTLGYSDIALAGGVSIDLNKINGYYYQSGGIESKDGKCRPFDRDANGTVFSDGVGIVVLKRLEDAIKDNDTIYGVIKGCGVNNDGADKLGYAAPSTKGQINCINSALIQSKVAVEDVSYIETHGTATELGDVIEFRALNEVYAQYTNKRGYCTLGSVKGNIGHADTAAGMAGLIKTILCLYYKKIPPLAHFNQPNPNINLFDSPFCINNKLLDWNSEKSPRLAGVSAFGIGGTNAHLILSEYQQPSTKPGMFNNKLVVLSAKTKKSLEQYTDEIIKWLNQDLSSNSSTKLYDFAYTLQTGRDDFQYRRVAIGNTKGEIIDKLAQSSINLYESNEKMPVVFMFSGQGTQYQGMAIQLLNSIEYFSSIVTECSNIAKKYLDYDIITIIKNDNKLINQTQCTQPALFIIEYALAKLLMYYGIIPHAMIGHSNGEYVAACLADVLSLEDAIKLICRRGILMANAPIGTMLSIECSLEEVIRLKGDIPVDIALHNSVVNCVVSGTVDAIQQMKNILDDNGISYQRLKVSHAFHSYLMEEASEKFKVFFQDITLSAPKIPIVSNVTGSWLTVEEITKPDYWCEHLRRTVKFKEGIETLIKDGYKCFIEVGPGSVLSSFTKAITQKSTQVSCIIDTLPNHKRFVSDEYQLLTAIGRLWQAGITINWGAFYGNEQRRHMRLPTYAFQRQRYWIEPDSNQLPNTNKNLDMNNWFYQPDWIRKSNFNVLEDTLINLDNYIWFIFGNKDSLTKELILLLNKHKAKVIIVEEDKDYSKKDSNLYFITPNDKTHYINLFTEVKNQINKPIFIIHLFSNIILNDENNSQQSNINQTINDSLNKGFYSLLYLSQAYLSVMGNESGFNCAVITNGSQNVLGTEIINPLNANLTGICRVIPQENLALKFKLIDLEVRDNIIQTCASDLLGVCIEEYEQTNPIIALRNNYSWQLVYNPIKMRLSRNRLKDHGIYIFTGGLGGISLTLSEIITKTVSKPVLVLLSRTEFPSQLEWDAILKDKLQSRLHNKIKNLQNLLNLGAIIHIEKCDITNLKTLQETTEHILNCHGNINGLIHAAGIAGGGLAQLKTKELANKVFAPKVHGTYNLAKVLNNYNLDFVVFCSSISAVIGEPGQIDYCAANACLDAFAISKLFNNSQFTVSIDWNTWQSVGMTVETERPDDIIFLNRGNDITPEQGQQLFMQILQNKYSQVAISTFDINVFSKIVSQSVKPQDFLNLAREDLDIITNYIPPSNEVEKQLANIWQEILGIEPVGIKDDFFEIGGHSLKALRLIGAIHKKLSYNISIKDIYENRTVYQLAKKLVTDKNLNIENEILFPLKIQDDNAPAIFMFPPIGGVTFCYENLINIWCAPFSVYGIQDPSIFLDNVTYTTISEMARSYYQAIKNFQSCGPYYLLGYSFGGTIAYEVAHMLQQDGEAINFLGMIDSWAHFSQTLYDEKNFKTFLSEQNEGLSESMIELAWGKMQLLTTYAPSHNALDITLFKATNLLKEYEEVDDEYNGWKKYNSGQLMVYQFYANHNTILSKNHVQQVFNILKDIIN